MDMPRKSGNQKGAQRHAEGAHGQRTHEAIMRQINDPAPASHSEQASDHPPLEGRHRLQEDRQQHDEAEKNSEKNREDAER
jgi:hypothetical protein